MITEYKNTDSYEPVFFESFNGVYPFAIVKFYVNRVGFGLWKYVKINGDSIDILGLYRGDNRRTVLFQDGNIIGYNLPRDFGIDSTIAMRYDIAHGLNLPPRNGRMLCPEFVCQLADQLANCRIQSAAALR